MEKPVKILMVCLGNICRSPLAHGILASKVKSKNVIVDSAGTAAYHIGNKPDVRSIAVAKKYQIDITKQKARQFKSTDFEDFDYIYVMDQSNYQNVIALATTAQQKAKVTLIMDELYPNQGIPVPDPYYGGEQGFEDVFAMLDKVCEKIAAKL